MDENFASSDALDILGTSKISGEGSPAAEHGFVPPNQEKS
jgi:hypothetical protein